MNSKEHNCPRPALWAGLDATVNRVGDTYIDQLELSGHARRSADLERFADLGVHTLRYPVLWERVAPQGVAQADWTWPDERLTRLRQLGIEPIIGLVHHGSGPRTTSLCDPEFPERLASYAEAVAARYPWVERFTPVNEPGTTARFSGLYGHWYPHGHDDQTFLRCLLTQCRAIVFAMQAIRAVVPHAQLLQTEDIGKTYSTPLLAGQAAFENMRRFLSLDLLCGRVNRGHPLWDYLRRSGISDAELAWFADHPCPPDIIGVNHYLSSERYLDERLERYPADTHGGNGMHHYADVLAARVRAAGAAGPYALLREVWERYGLPLAVTEVHNGSTREEQLRWLAEVWQAAHRLWREDIAIRAVTVWSLLGVYGWDQLVTSPNGRYEPGCFDLRGPAPRPTALARLVSELAAGQAPTHPVLAGPGWWHRPERFLYGHACDEAGTDVDPRTAGVEVVARDGRTTMQPLLITGATGTLGQAFARICAARGLPYRLTRRAELDIADRDAVARLLDTVRPWAVVNAAGYVRVDAAEADAERCRRENTIGPGVLAAACAERQLGLVTFSSDLVFDGSKRAPYVESDPVHPLNVYGQTKAAAEALVLTRHPAALVVRCSAFFGPWDAYNFVTIALHELAAVRPFVVVDDSTVSPTYVPDLVHAVLDLLVDGESGIWHLANSGAVTWAAFARLAAARAGVDCRGLEVRQMADMPWPARRPECSVLGTERGQLLPSLEDALGRYLSERERSLA